MTKLQIVLHLLDGNHLSDKELKQAQELVNYLQKEIDKRK